ncbi:hypothetical protein ACLOJK_011774 [Asimina triloba]
MPKLHEHDEILRPNSSVLSGLSDEAFEAVERRRTHCNMHSITPDTVDAEVRFGRANRKFRGQRERQKRQVDQTDRQRKAGENVGGGRKRSKENVDEILAPFFQVKFRRILDGEWSSIVLLSSLAFSQCCGALGLSNQSFWTVHLVGLGRISGTFSVSIAIGFQTNDNMLKLVRLLKFVHFNVDLVFYVDLGVSVGRILFECIGNGLSSLFRQLLFTIWLSGLHDVMATQMLPLPNSDAPNTFVLSDPPLGLFDPIEISPAVVPRYPSPGEALSPMYPSFPSTYDPVLTGRCPVNFSSVSSIMGKTASDCSAPLAALVGNVICCPQLRSLLHVFQGISGKISDKLVLEEAVADDCFSDIINVLASRGANRTISKLCSVKSSNLTGGSCPVKDMAKFEKLVNISKLLDSCSNVDPLKECCRPVCQPAIAEAALRISLTDSSLVESANVIGKPTGLDFISDCKEVVYAWLSRKLPLDAANTAFRILSSCKVNKVCPLEFKEPSAVIKACSDAASPNPSCCGSLNTYVATIQKQMLITNRQAINCATLFGSMLQKGGVMTNVYELCDVDLKDFSLQGCLLRSLPADVIFDNSSGFSFTCDLNDNIAAPWPSSSSLSSLPLCAPGGVKNNNNWLEHRDVTACITNVSQCYLNSKSVERRSPKILLLEESEEEKWVKGLEGDLTGANRRRWWRRQGWEVEDRQEEVASTRQRARAVCLWVQVEQMGFKGVGGLPSGINEDDNGQIGGGGVDDVGRWRIDERRWRRRGCEVEDRQEEEEVASARQVGSTLVGREERGHARVIVLAALETSFGYARQDVSTLRKFSTG